MALKYAVDSNRGNLLSGLQKASKEEWKQVINYSADMH